MFNVCVSFGADKYILVCSKIMETSVYFNQSHSVDIKNLDIYVKNLELCVKHMTHKGTLY